MFCIEDRQLQCVDDTSDGIDDAAGQEPAETCTRQVVKDRHESEYAQPAHSDIDYRRNPFRAGDPAALEDHTDNGNGPDKRTENISGAAMKNDEAYRGIAAGDHDEDHFFQAAVHLGGGIYRVIKCAGQIKQDHSQDKNAHSKNMKHIGISCSLYDQRSSAGCSKKHGNTMSDRASGIF